MQVFNANSGGVWLDGGAHAEADAGKPSPAEQEARRALSDLFRCNNLVVLAGLGTSLCVKGPDGEKLAPTMPALWDRVKSAHEVQELVEAPGWLELLELVRHSPDNRNIEALLSQCRLAEAFLTAEDLTKVQSFIKLAEQEIYAAVNFLQPNHALPAHSEFLRRAARRSNRKSRTKLFTTNYDRCFEEAGRQGRYVVIDGFSQTVPPTFDAVYFTYDIVRRDRENDTQDFIPNVFHLYKLHGSIDWERDGTSGEILKVTTASNPLLIYPRNSKYELAFEQPYLEMMSALQAALREPNTGLLVVGFGFNDSHLAEPIMSAVRSNLSLKAVAVSPGLAPWTDADGVAQPGEVGTNTHLVRLKSLADNGDARLTLLNCTFEELVGYVPDIVAETDLEKHFERLRKLEELR